MSRSGPSHSARRTASRTVAPPRAVIARKNKSNGGQWVEPEVSHEFNAGGAYGELTARLQATSASLDRLLRESTAALTQSTHEFHTYLQTVHPSGLPYPHGVAVGPPLPAFAPPYAAPLPMKWFPDADLLRGGGADAAAVPPANALASWGVPIASGEHASLLAAEAEHKLRAYQSYWATRGVTAPHTEPAIVVVQPPQPPAPLSMPASANAAPLATAPATDSAAIAHTLAVPAPTASVNGSTDPADATVQVIVVSPHGAAAAAADAKESSAAQHSSSSPANTVVATGGSAAAAAAAPTRVAAVESVDLLTRHTRKLNRRVDHYVDDLVQSLAHRMTIAPPAF